MSIPIGPGKDFAGYRIDELIGRGGMGVVYRATDLSLERPVALKLIAPEHADNATFRSRFLKEPKLAAALDHPNVVPIYEAREHDGQLYLAMRFVAGTDLRTHLAEQGRLDADMALHTLAQVADALDAAHRRGLVHRDVKPANILLDDERHAYLTDFGISKQLNSQSTATEQLVGTLDYMAPERIRGERADSRSDQYALACVLFECLAGTPPFRRETGAETLWEHMQGEPPTVPGQPELERVIAKALAKDPDDRYDTCTALIAACEPAPMTRERELPTGVVSFVFTDIEGSTRLLRELGDGYEELLDVHNGLLRAVWMEYRGYEIATDGDSFVVAFERADAAVAAAVAAQRALHAAQWRTTLPVRVRIGVHSGFARPRDGDYVALALHQAARVVDAAHGGQIIVSGETVARVVEVPPGVRLERLGRFRVRDFDEPPELFRAVVAGMRARDIALRVRPAEGHNLVRPTTSFEDRVDDLRVLTDLARPGSVTSLVGPGGVGKTRLVTETALRIADAWDDGAWFVDLAPVSEPALVPGMIARAVGARATPDGDPWAEVLDHLRDRCALVILDNCEHLVEAACTCIIGLLEACPRVGVVATSRAPLGLRAERVHRLEPLPWDGADAPAVRLFRERAAGREAGDEKSVTKLCAELDGLPLAIELAAARASALRPDDILALLLTSPSVLRSRDPSLPSRQRTLDRLLDWSSELLDPGTLAVLRRLTVFAGSFDLGTAELVCAGDGVERAEVAEHLWTLVDSSLVTSELAAGTSRYRLLATVRAYAAHRAGAEERAEALRRLAAVYLDRLGPWQATDRSWVGAVELELDNLRQVVADLPDDADAQALAWSVGRYHDVIDAFRTGIEELTRWKARLPSQGPNRVALMTLLADLHLRVGELDRAAALVEDAAEVCSRTGAPAWDEAGLARTRGELALRRGDPASAADEARRALAAPVGDRGRARLLNLLGIALGTLGDVPGAAASFDGELAAASAAGMDTFLATTHGNLAEAHLQLGDESAAADHQAMSLDLARANRQPVIVAFSMMIAARLTATRGEARQAVVLQAAADAALEGAAYALYDEDLEVRDALMNGARQHLGEREYHVAVAEGRGLDNDAAADLAAVVLRGVRQQPAGQEVVR